jgi:hypothetical protein
MARVLGSPLFFRKSRVAAANDPEPAQIRKTQAEPVSITLSATAVGMIRGICFWVTTGTIARVLSEE